MTDTVRLDVEDGVGTIQLRHRPKNALSTSVLEDIREAATEAAARRDVRAVVVHGGDVVYGGEPVFSVGADLREFAATTRATSGTRAWRWSTALSAVADIPKPTVAAVTGYALGGGLELALCCDRRVAGASARLGLPEVTLGVIPGAGGTQRLARLVGVSVAKELIYTGRVIGAEEAASLGIVDEVVDPGIVHERALAWAAQFVEGAPLALAAAKAAIDGGLGGGLEAGLRLESHLFASLFSTEDKKIGVQSCLDIRAGKVHFTGH